MLRSFDVFKLEAFELQVFGVGGAAAAGRLHSANSGFEPMLAEGITRETTVMFPCCRRSLARRACRACGRALRG